MRAILPVHKNWYSSEDTQGLGGQPLVRPCRKVFAENLRLLCEKRKTSNAALAEAANVSVAAVTLWLQGERLPRAEQIDKIAAYLNASFVDFFTDSHDARPDQLAYLRAIELIKSLIPNT